MSLFPASSQQDGALELLSHDPRTWEARTRVDGELLGRVVEVLLDEDGAPRHLEVDLAGDDRHVLVPVGHVSVDPEEEVVWIPGLARSAFEDIPAYPGRASALEPEYERSLGAAYDRAYVPSAYYESPHYRTGWEGGAGERPVESPEATGRAPVRVDTLSDVDVAEHDHDPRGWAVVGRDGERLGEVEHLMGDLATMKVRYLSVRLDEGGGPGEGSRAVLVPAGHASLEPGNERVRVDGLDADRVRSYPAWNGPEVTREYERSVTEHLGAGYTGERRYGHPRYRPGHLRSPRAST